ncbi:MAG TPA: lipopolysaccharide biosynthesis protein [Candidatus Binataceae bacterium]
MKNSVTGNIAWTYANWAVSLAVPLVMVPIYLRYLGTVTYGQWLVVLSLTSYLSLANLGMAQAVSNRAAEALAQDRSHEVGALISTAFFTYAAVAAVIVAAFAIAAPYFGGRLALHGGPAVLAAALVYLGLVMIGFPLKVHLMMLRAFQRVDQEQAINAGTNTVRVAILALALVAGFKLLAVALINGASEVLAPLVAYRQLRRQSSEAWPRLARFSSRLLREMLKPSLGFLGIQIGGTLISGLDNLVIGYALGAAAVTLYAVPMRLMVMCASVFSVALVALVPTVTANFALGRVERIGSGLMFSIRLALLYATVGAIALIVVGPAFLRLWAGREVFPGHLTYGLQVALFWLTVWAAPGATVLWATTRHYAWSVLSVVEGLLNLALSLWWVRRYGLVGVIGGTIAAALLTNAWFIPYAALRTLHVSLRSAARELAPGAAVCAAALAATVILWRPESAASLPESAAVAALIVVAFVLAFGLIGLSDEERRAARAVVGGWVRQERAA